MSYEQANWSKVPEHTAGGIRRYIERGIPPGSFLQAVFSNDLTNAFGCADEINRHALFDIVSFVYNYAPIGCHGSRERVDAWISSGGTEGQKEGTHHVEDF
jgi:hypothetical protein